MAGRAPQELRAGEPVVVVCASGHRSKSAAQALVERGFTTVYDMHGGLNAWRRQGLPLKKPD